MQGEHIVVVDDDPQLCIMVERYLSAEGLRVSTVPSAESFWKLIESDPPDLALIDVRLPGEDGLSVARQLRERFPVGIIMLSSQGDATDRIIGLEIGADGYLPKPFELRELLARVRSVLRRVQPRRESSASRNLRYFSGWTLDLGMHELLGPEGERETLSHREFELMRLLAARPRQVLSRNVIMDQVFHREWEGLDRTVDILIHQLRTKIEVDAKKPMLIRTVRGAGYVLATEVSSG